MQIENPLAEKLSAFHKSFDLQVKSLRPAMKEIRHEAGAVQARTIKLSEDIKTSMEAELDSIPSTLKKWIEPVLRKSIDEVQAALDKGLIADLSDFLSERMSIYESNADCFSIVVFGKVNSGKSTLINLLLGLEVSGHDKDKCASTLIDSKAKVVSIHRDSSGNLVEESIPFLDIDAVECTAQIQRGDIGSLRIYDTPGLDSKTGVNHDLARGFVRNADLVVYTMHGRAPLKASDMVNLGYVVEHNKRVLPVTTKNDETTPFGLEMKKRTDIEAQQKRCAKELTSVKALKPLLVKKEPLPTSAKVAYVFAEQQEMLTESGIPDFLDAIRTTIEKEGFFLRVSNPLSALKHVVSRAYEAVEVLDQGVIEVEKRNTWAQDRFNQINSELDDYIDDNISEIDLYKDLMTDRLRAFLDEVVSLPFIKKVLGSKLHITKGGRKKAEKELAKEIEKKFIETVFCPDELQKVIAGVVEKTTERTLRELEKIVDGLDYKKPTKGPTIPADDIGTGAIDALFHTILRAIKTVVQSALVEQLVKVITKKIAEVALKEGLKQILKFAVKAAGAIVGIFLFMVDVAQLKKKRAEIREKLFNEINQELIKNDLAGPVRAHLKSSLEDIVAEFEQAFAMPGKILSAQRTVINDYCEAVNRQVEKLESTLTGMSAGATGGTNV